MLVLRERLGFDYDEVRVDQAGYRQTWEELLEEYATPLSTPTDVIINRVAHSLKQQVGVAIGGEGADEAFCGYTIPHWSGTDFDRAQFVVESAIRTRPSRREKVSCVSMDATVFIPRRIIT